MEIRIDKVVSTANISGSCHVCPYREEDYKVTRLMIYSRAHVTELRYCDAHLAEFSDEIAPHLVSVTPKRVRVTGCDDRLCWYFGSIGEVFEVIGEREDDYFVKDHRNINTLGLYTGYILKTDCETVHDEMP